MNRWIGWARGLVLVIWVGVALLVAGCEGTDTREKVDDTVKEVTGKKDVDRYRQMKKDLNNIQDQQADRYRQLDQEEKKE